VALIRSQGVLDDVDAEGEQQAGVNLVRRAIEAPLRFIADNAGVEGSIVVDKVKGLKGAWGFNAQTEEYEDLLEAGILDPTKVVRSALQNAASVASLLLTTEALIAEKPEKTKGGGMPDMGGMGGMGGMGDMM
jgi:chaperonin GroEL